MSRQGSGFGGDERNPNSRRYKGWNNPHKASNDGLADRRVYPENSNRPRYSESNLKQTQAGKYNNQRSKLRSPAKTGLGQPTIRINRSHTAAKSSGMTKIKSDMAKVKPDSETSERKQKLSNIASEKKEAIEQVENSVEVNNKEEQLVQHENGNDTESHGNEATEKESVNKREISENEKSENGNAENGNSENGNSENGNSENVQSENGEIPQIQEKDEEEFALQLEAEENNSKPAGDAQTNLLNSNKNDEQNEPQSENVKEDIQAESESCSVEIVESTTSEVTEVLESNAPEIQDKDREHTNEDVLFDTNITLKDVKIKLNDCLKESKTEDENNVDQSLPEYAHKEDTFGKTLRTISGRKSIGRHITLRDRQPSPNSSLFVNTSNVSMFEEGNSDYKILRHRSTLAELTANNGGTPLDRKRKLARDSPNTFKKAKTEESSLLNYSLELLKYPFSPRRPVQVSTPYKFEAEKHISTSEQVVVDEPGTAKKWCVIM